MKYKWQMILAGVIALLLVAAFVIQRSNHSPQNVAETQTQANQAVAQKTPDSVASSSLVVVHPVSESVINNSLTAIGTGRANATVSLKPWTSGKMTELKVAAGDKVEIGMPVAQLDFDNEKIAVEKARISLNDAELALARTTELRKTNTATEVQAINARLTLETAKLALEDAELALERRTIRAPLSGIVGILPVDVGNYVTTDTTIARIDDRSLIQIDIWVPERFAPLIHVGNKVTASAIARPGTHYDGKIIAIDNMIEEDSRTLRIRAQMDNKDDALRAGMSFNVAMAFAGDSYPIVDPLAIQWNSKGAFVWKINNDNKAEAVPVSIVQRNANSVAVNGDLKLNDLIAIQGLQNLREGRDVIIKNTIDAKKTSDAKNANTMNANAAQQDQKQ